MKNAIRMCSWALLSLMFLALSLTAPMWYPFANEANIQVVLFKTSLALGSGYVGFWLASHAFPYAATETPPYVAKAIVMAAVIIGVCMGL
jgi:hypothetical protein